ncbi:bifunctional adenosylcobinamide kinase/adenosylcobinamide-phosphate guanylyltransferase [Ferrimonas sediminicola]|uniref:Bifunctional adenosylcobalamin biosynthesis protein n=1 Tax=Ferrimonas sediminicola TaxID=2569538 RepID=A0A4U1BHN3_9GAMM|nr:bifunctional adenosylcobinamide kinase/adenosylcobinamide-phosphate guanylyltransferase [Ferrimonas sediminicola]TKB50276.1 bifunctional adenosylcobinamide kinase/adenosylcobinamide-phosphate guanylyltransferase [Ferrimonas sediminicola]
MIHLFLGGARSGKSSLAEALCHRWPGQVVYVATARSHPSMAERIELHRRRRPQSWHCVEEPLALARLLAEAGEDQLLLIDCLTLWLTNQMMAGACLDQATEGLIGALSACRAEVVLVSTEVGQGLIPDDPMSRAFVVAAGELHQGIARVADRVSFCQAGHPIPVKGERP